MDGRAGTRAGGDSVRVVVFLVEGQRYGLALDAVERVLPMVAAAPLPQAPAVALGVINLHGRVVPVVDVRRRSGLPSRAYGLAGHLLVVRTSRRVLALPVDEVVGVAEAAASEVAPPHAVLPGIGRLAGILPLADGLLFIYDLDAFLSLAEERDLSAALAEAGGSLPGVVRGEGSA